MAWGLALAGPGCDGDNASSTTDAATNGATETTEGPSTGMSGSTANDTAETTSTTTVDESTTAVATTDDTTTGFGSSSGSSGTTTFGTTFGTTGGLGPQAYGPCEDMIFCALEGESCSFNETTHVCGASDCETALDCPLPDPAQDGTAEVACRDIAGLPTQECILDCSAGQTCPTGMTCANDNYCAWPL